MEIGIGRPHAMWIDWLEWSGFRIRVAQRRPVWPRLESLALDEKTKKAAPPSDVVRGALDRFAKERSVVRTLARITSMV